MSTEDTYLHDVNSARNQLTCPTLLTDDKAKEVEDLVGRLASFFALNHRECVNVHAALNGLLQYVDIDIRVLEEFMCDVLGNLDLADEIYHVNSPKRKQ